MTSATLRRAYAIHPVAAVQLEYSATERDVEGEAGTNILATCRELGIALVCYAPLGRGLLTTTFKDGAFGTDSTDMRSAVFPQLQAENRAANMAVVNSFADIAAKKHCTTSQLALAWLLKQGSDIIPIPGTKKMKYLEENWAALDVELSDEEERQIRAFVERSGLVGERQPARFGNVSGGLLDTKKEGA